MSEEGKMTKREEAIRLRAEQLTYKAIGKKLGVSKERVRQLIKGNPKRPKPDLQAETMLKPGDVAVLLGIHVNTVRRWGDSGLLKSYRISVRGDRRFKREDIEKYLEEVRSW